MRFSITHSLYATFILLHHSYIFRFTFLFSLITALCNTFIWLLKGFFDICKEFIIRLVSNIEYLFRQLQLIKYYRCGHSRSSVSE